MGLIRASFKNILLTAQTPRVNYTVSNKRNEILEPWDPLAHSVSFQVGGEKHCSLKMSFFRTAFSSLLFSGNMQRHLPRSLLGSQNKHNSHVILLIWVGLG